MRRLIALFLLLVAVPAAAQRVEPEWRQAREEQVFVRVGAFEPDPLRLEAGRPTRLVFYNGSRARLSVEASRFFAAARVRSGDSELVEGGGFSLGPGETKAITLVPAEGRYSLSSGSWLRRLFGMSARIIVEPRQRSEGRPVES